MSCQRCQAASAGHHGAEPRAGNGVARPNAGRSVRTDPRDGPELTARRTPHGICRGFHDDPLGIRTGAGTSRCLRARLNPHRDPGTA